MFSQFRIIVILSFIFVLLYQMPFQVSGREYPSDGNINRVAVKSGQRVKENIIRPVLAVTPREVDFGIFGVSEGIKRNILIKNVGSGTVQWSIKGPEGWSLLENQKLSGAVQDKPANLSVTISSLKEGNGKVNNGYLVKLTLEADNRSVSYRKHVMSGAQRVMLKLVSNGGTRNIFARFKLPFAGTGPVINVEPLRVDFGVIEPGQQVTKRVKVSNNGMNTLKWLASIQNDNHSGMSDKSGRYVSFLNEDIKDKGIYTPSSYLKDVMDITGRWSELNGYPSSRNAHNVLRYRFWGTGISVFFSIEPNGGKMTAYVDEKVRNNHECLVGQKDRAECIIAEGLSYGHHTLTILGTEEQAIIEGVKIYGKAVMKAKKGWISLFPNSGTTNRETDFVNIKVNTQQLNPGYYGGDIIFKSNGGQALVEVSLEISEANIQRILDVYRYFLENDYLYTTNPQDDVKFFRIREYRKQGIAFRLFSPNTPGTTPFFRWYHSAKKNHFYSYDRNGEGKLLNGFSFEGTIGNIGTSRLTNTRELYRWFNPDTGGYFYTTDPNGEGHLKKGYRFDGIAGYVR